MPSIFTQFLNHNDAFSRRSKLFVEIHASSLEFEPKGIWKGEEVMKKERNAGKGCAEERRK